MLAAVDIALAMITFEGNDVVATAVPDDNDVVAVEDAATSATDPVRDADAGGAEIVAAALAPIPARLSEAASIAETPRAAAAGLMDGIDARKLI